MKKLLATLRVYVTDESTEMSSLNHSIREPRVWNLNLRPEGDKLHSPKFGRQTQDILAHELGHFVSAAGLSNAALEAETFLDNMAGPSLREEQRAWDLAKVIKPDLDEGIKRFALGNYEHGKRLGQVRE